MPAPHTLLRNATVLDGSGGPPQVLDVALVEDRIAHVGASLPQEADRIIDASGLALAPGFIDTHTHDDFAVLERPEMLPKLSQGVTTVIVGNCGISASPVTLNGPPPDPMNLLGETTGFRYATFASYVDAVGRARPAVNVAALVGHTALRSNHMDRFDREAGPGEIAAMRAQLSDALAHGALGLSTGLAYRNANAASTAEVLALTPPLAAAGGLYATHLRTEGDAVLDALEEAFCIGRHARVPVVVSHLKCAGIANWGRAGEVLRALDEARITQSAGCDCYPYAAGSSTLDLSQVDTRVEITITWSDAHPEAAGRALAQIAEEWKTSQHEAARRLQPAGAIYHSIDEHDMRRILAHPATMIGSDGLPNDAHPHPRLWGAFPRVLGRYCRDEKLFPLPEAIRKMTSLSAERFGLVERGRVREGYFADLVLFDPLRIRDTATYDDPIRPAEGIQAVWVNGALAYTPAGATTIRAGRFLPRAPKPAARAAAHVASS
ncbi:MAG TPA: D-aminoacylase [Terracidiphilus sp.]|nr:D-aminoacylase [Terracidiphilus sp.]